MDIQQSIDALLTKDIKEVQGFINQIKTHVAIGKTRAIAHCHYIRLDGNGRPRLNDFAEFLADKLVDFVIPRTEIQEAHEYAQKNQSQLRFSQLKRKAIGLFNRLEKTGEPGELLLYILLQEMLGLPQLLCKMPLKTDHQMPVHGVDGVHVGFDTATQKLALYWGESKIYQSIDGAISNCFNDLSAYLLARGGQNSPLEREFQLIKDNLDLIDGPLEEALVQYLDKTHPDFNKVIYKGACLIGFDNSLYPGKPNVLDCNQLKLQFESSYMQWVKKVDNRITLIQDLDGFEIHVFLIPFPDVQQFRNKFIELLK